MRADGFIWSADTGMRALPGRTIASPVSATGINDSGQITGGDWYRGFLWNRDGSYVTFRCGAELEVYVRGINEHGQIVGFGEITEPRIIVDPNNYFAAYPYKGFVWTLSDGCRTVVDDRYVTINAVDINDRGEVAGHGGTYVMVQPPNGGPAGYLDLNDIRALRWRLDHTPVFHAPSGPVSALNISALNNRGDAVGRVSDQAVIWTRRGFPHETREVLPRTLRTLGGASGALGINNMGDVVGWSRDAAGRQRAVIWRKEEWSRPTSHPLPIQARPDTGRAPFRNRARSDLTDTCYGKLRDLFEAGAILSCPR